jgi:hypothetical protein
MGNVPEASSAGNSSAFRVRFPEEHTNQVRINDDITLDKTIVGLLAVDAPSPSPTSLLFFFGHCRFGY